MLEADWTDEVHVDFSLPFPRKSLGKMWRHKKIKRSRGALLDVVSKEPPKCGIAVARRGKSLQFAEKKLKVRKPDAPHSPPTKNPLTLLSVELVSWIASYLPVISGGFEMGEHSFVTAATLARFAGTPLDERDGGGAAPNARTPAAAARDDAILRLADERVRAYGAVDNATYRLVARGRQPWAAEAERARALAAKLRTGGDGRGLRTGAVRYRSRALGELVGALARIEPRDLRVPSSLFGTVQEAVDFSRRGDRVAVDPGRYADVITIGETKAVTIFGLGEPGSTILEAVDVRGGECVLKNVNVSCCDVGQDTPACAVSGPRARLVVLDADINSRALLSGVAARDGAALVLARCAIRGCRESAVFVHGPGTSAILDRCVLANSGASGLSVHLGAAATATKCDFLDNKENGVHASNAVVTIADCACLDNAYNATFSQHAGKVHADDACRLGPNWDFE